MQDMIAAGEAWFEQQRRQHLAVNVEYRPRGALLPRTCRATLVVGKWESLDSAGQIVRMETRDFLIHTDDLPSEPKRGDKIAVASEGSEQIYEVAIPDGAQAAWRWADRQQRVRRIHTMATTSSAPASPSLYLVVAVGASPDEAITDLAIKSQFSASMQASRAIARQVVADQDFIYVVLPTSFGQPSIAVGGLTVTAWNTTVRNIVFDGQASRSYTIYRSLYPVTGNVSIKVT